MRDAVAREMETERNCAAGMSPTKPLRRLRQFGGLDS